MKPHELIQRRRRQRGAKAAPPQMRDRNATAAPGAPATPAIAVADPRNQLPARRPAFAGETRAQELERQRLSAVVIRPGGPGAPLQPAPAGGAAVQPQVQPAAAPPPSPQNVITMCACTSHGDDGCDEVATLRMIWPQPDAGPWPQLTDVCEGCAAAIKADPVASLVTGLQFVGLFPPMHDAVEDEPDAEDAAPAAPPAVTSGTVTP